MYSVQMTAVCTAWIFGERLQRIHYSDTCNIISKNFFFREKKCIEILVYQLNHNPMQIQILSAWISSLVTYILFNFVTHSNTLILFRQEQPGVHAHEAVPNQREQVRPGPEQLSLRQCPRDHPLLLKPQATHQRGRTHVPAVPCGHQNAIMQVQSIDRLGQMSPISFLFPSFFFMAELHHQKTRKGPGQNSRWSDNHVIKSGLKSAFLLDQHGTTNSTIWWTQWSLLWPKLCQLSKDFTNMLHHWP